MSTLRRPARSAGTAAAVILDLATARLQHRVRVALIELLNAAAPSDREVVDSSTWATVALDVAVRPQSESEERPSVSLVPLNVPLLLEIQAERQGERRLIVTT